MGASSQWLFKGSVIYTRFFDDVTAADITENGLEHMRLLGEISHNKPVHLIVDGSNVHSYPHSIKTLKHAVNAAVFARTGWLILVSEDYFQQHIAQIFARLFQVRFRASSNLREAYHFLQDRMAIPPPQDWPQGINDTMPQR